VEAQALLSPWPLVVGALVLLTLGVVPGVPKLPTLVGGAALVLAAWWLGRAPAAARDAEGEVFAPRAERDARPAAGNELVIELGMGLLGLLEEPSRPGGIAELLARLRAEMSRALGFSLPAFAVRDSLELRATEYGFAYRAATLGQGRVRPQRLLAVAQSAGVTPDVGTLAELADGRTGVWVPAEEAEALGEQGYALLSPAEAIVEHLRVVVRRRAGNMFDLQRAGELLRQIEMTHPEAMRAAEAAGLTAGLVSQVGRLLLEAGIPLRDPLGVVEGIVEGLPQETDPEKLALNLRPRLAGMITDYLSREGRIRAVELDPELEEELAEAAYRRADGTVAALPPDRAAAWVLALDQLGKEYGWGEPLAVICESRSLQPLASLCVQAQSHLIALQPAELTDAADIEFVTRLGPDQIPVASGE
jgi:flagellar biosynthesis protein FlhA